MVEKVEDKEIEPVVEHRFKWEFFPYGDRDGIDLVQESVLVREPEDNSVPHRYDKMIEKIRKYENILNKLDDLEEYILNCPGLKIKLWGHSGNYIHIKEPGLVVIMTTIANFNSDVDGAIKVLEYIRSKYKEGLDRMLKVLKEHENDIITIVKNSE